MRLNIITILLVLLNSNLIHSQPKNCACCSETYRQFDFWLGAWEVSDTAGNIVGFNNIVLKQDSCILQENWRSAKSNFAGTSYNYFGSQDSLWHQTWIDNQGGSLELYGKLQEGKMILRSDLLPGKKGSHYYNRITWTPYKDGSVRQVWEILDENDQVMSILFNGLYKRK